jgi:hypothetical protein
VSAWFGLAAGHDSGVGDLLPWWRDGDGAEQGRHGGVHRWWGGGALWRSSVASGGSCSKVRRIGNRR